MSTDDRVELLRRFFFSRSDVAAVAAPWNGGKPCPVNVESEDHLIALLTAHVLGSAAPAVEVRYTTQRGPGEATGRYLVGSYTLALDSTTRWLALDFDDHGGGALANPRAAAIAAAERAEAAGLSVYLEKSKGGRGWHLRAFFEAATDGAIARKLGEAIASDKRIEIFPKQDALRGSSKHGNMMWLPWWYGAPSGANRFYRLDGETVYEPEFVTNTEEEIVAALAYLTPTPPVARPAPSSNSTTRPEDRDWRRRALDRLPLEAVYGQWLTGKPKGIGWLECRDPWSTTGDRDPSACVADGNGEAERGSFHSFRSGETMSVFDFMIKRDGVDFKGAAEEVARMSGVERTREKSKARMRTPPNDEPARCNRTGECVSEEPTTSEKTWMDRLLCTDKGVIKVAIGNMLLIFQNDEAWAGTLGFNERTQCVVFRRKPPMDIRGEVGDCLTDEHVTQTTIWLQEVYNYALRGTALVHLAMIAAARLCSFDPVKDWLETLKWDGTERLDLWLPHLVGCDATPYSKAVGAKVLISAVSRVYEPGSKVDTVMVLTGPQGTLKSTLLRELAVRPEWFTDHLSDVGGKDAALQLCGPWIMEFAELDGITGRREAERVKSWLTQTKDRFRPPYGRSVIDIPRRVVFTGTSNLHQFLRDETGGRRFLPIEIREIDIDGIRSVREQLWAEARHRYLAGENWWLEGDVLDEARCQQEERRIADPWEDEITKWIVDQVNPTFVTSRDILTNAVKVEVGRQTKADLDRVGRVLGHSLGWTRAKRRDGKVVLSVWYPPKKEGQETVVPLRYGPLGEVERADEKERWEGR